MKLKRLPCFLTLTWIFWNYDHWEEGLPNGSELREWFLDNATSAHLGEGCAPYVLRVSNRRLEAYEEEAPGKAFWKRWLLFDEKAPRHPHKVLWRLRGTLHNMGEIPWAPRTLCLVLQSQLLNTSQTLIDETQLPGDQEDFSVDLPLEPSPDRPHVLNFTFHGVAKGTSCSGNGTKVKVSGWDGKAVKFTHRLVAPNPCSLRSAAPSCVMLLNVQRSVYWAFHILLGCAFLFMAIPRIPWRRRMHL
eukprot:TRINITY_DN81200_c0_g1_i1.p1 TRINITY_DN81200_c0_g1~~TRINITY_DN81200_c0_g1_i1.p1  ORF type:complete len:246 (-),score=42.45 TRINITY_DN81200_c0_g1_i1:9-746(-)